MKAGIDNMATNKTGTTSDNNFHDVLKNSVKI
jgi:hypothetical protein